MADAQKYIQGVKYKLAGSGITATATTIILQSFKLPDGSTNITTAMTGGTGYLTLEPGTSKEENVSFTTVTQNADGTATLTGVVRGLNFVAPYTTSSALRLAHAGGTIAIMSNSAPFYNELSGKDNDETITGVWTFTNPNIPLMTAYSAPTSDLQLASKKYVDDIASGGTASVDRIIPAATAGATVAAGDCVYFDETDKEWKLADGSASSTCENVLLGIAQGAGTNGALISGGVLLAGLDSNQSGFTAGDIIYISDVAGTLAASGGTVEAIVGYAHSATQIFFMPGFKGSWTAVNADILPDTTDTYDIGSDAKRFKDGYFEGDVDIDGTLNVEGAVTLQSTLEATGITTVADESVTKTTAAPTADAQIANKKYVDDEVSGNLAVQSITTASDVLKVSADTEQSTNSSNYGLKKSIKVLRGGVYRVKFDFKSNGAAWGYGRTYVNGVAEGAERMGTTSYVTYSEDITLEVNDYIQIYIRGNGGSGYGYVKNFRLYYDLSTVSDNTIVTN